MPTCTGDAEWDEGELVEDVAGDRGVGGIGEGPSEVGEEPGVTTPEKRHGS